MNLQFALHLAAHQGPGGLRLRLDARRRRAGRRLRQAGHDRRQSEVEALRQGDQQGLHRGPRRSAPHGIHRRQALPVGRRAVGQPHSGCSTSQESCRAETGAHDRRSRGQIGISRAAHLLRAARADAGAGAVPTRRTRRPHRDGALQHKGEFITSHSMPTEGGGDGYGYDLAVNPKQNVLLTSSFTGYATTCGRSAS